jgi:ubiquinone biosynthesis protein
MSYGDLVEELPAQLNEFFRAVRRRDISLQLEHRGLDRLTGEIEHASMNISWSLVIAAIIISASVLVLADNLDGSSSALTTLATLAIAAAMVTGLGRLVVSRFRKH